MSAHDYEAFLERALFLDRPDPVTAWGDVSARQRGLIERLADAQEIRIEADGTDLRLRVDGRTWINSDGKHNMPSGEIFTGPLEDSANGTIRYTIPSSPPGAQVEDIRLTFAGGQVVDAAAERGDDYLRAALDTDPGARFLGELGIGTNPGIDRADRLDPARREDRRHRTPGARPLLSRDRGHELLGAALGHDLRPARRRPAERGWPGP